jgi:hypothetical protein
MPKSSHKDDHDQSRRFIETACELGCNEDEAAFDEKLRRIAIAKPTSKAKAKKRSRPNT